MSVEPQAYEAPRFPDGRFWRLIGLSLAVHALLFFAISWHHKTLPDPVRPLMVNLRLVIADSASEQHSTPVSFSESGAVVTREVAPATTLLPKARQQVAAATPKAVSRMTQAAGPANVPAESAPSTTPAQTAPISAESATASVVSQRSENTRPVEAARGEVVARGQGDPLAAYRQRLSDLFARGFEYPRVAAMRGWEGEVRLRLKVARRGNLLGVVLDRSSGFDVLDQHALTLLAGYGDLPPLPDALEASEIQVVVPIQYKLKKTT